MKKIVNFLTAFYAVAMLASCASSKTNQSAYDYPGRPKQGNQAQTSTQYPDDVYDQDKPMPVDSVQQVPDQQYANQTQTNPVQNAPIVNNQSVLNNRSNWTQGVRAGKGMSGSNSLAAGQSNIDRMRYQQTLIRQQQNNQCVNQNQNGYYQNGQQQQQQQSSGTPRRSIGSNTKTIIKITQNR